MMMKWLRNSNMNAFNIFIIIFVIRDLFVQQSNNISNNNLDNVEKWR